MWTELFRAPSKERAGRILFRVGGWSVSAGSFHAGKAASLRSICGEWGWAGSVAGFSDFEEFDFGPDHVSFRLVGQFCRFDQPPTCLDDPIPLIAVLRL